MNTLRGACIFGQSGGPTAVINSSALGAIQAALASEAITNVYAAVNGIRGVLGDELVDCGKEDPAELELLRNTPSAFLGTCRYKLKDPAKDDTDYKRILEIFKKYNVRYFFYNGGNDSMDTCNKISKYMMHVGYECRIMGIPKTVDNDLFGTDHCPGFGSAAKYVATSCAEVTRDGAAQDIPVITIIEAMGRNAGWLAGSSALANLTGSGPDLVYLPEIPFDPQKFVSDIDKKFETKKHLTVVVSEGVRDKDGKYITEYTSSAAATKDMFGHVQMGNLAGALVDYVKNCSIERLRSVKLIGIELSRLQRAASHWASAADVEEAYLAGKTAVEKAVEGFTDKMVAFERAFDESGKYLCKTKLVELSVTANAEKKVPLNWITEDGAGVTQEFIDYVLPLIQGTREYVCENGLPRYPRLKKILAKDLI